RSSSLTATYVASASWIRRRFVRAVEYLAACARRSSSISMFVLIHSIIHLVYDLCQRVCLENERPVGAVCHGNRPGQREAPRGDLAQSAAGRIGGAGDRRGVSRWACPARGR